MRTHFLADLAERTIVTYLQALAGLLIASGQDWLDVGAWQAAALAAVPAALAVVKGALGDLLTGTASLVQPRRGGPRR